MENLKTIQEIIDQRANDRLDKDLKELERVVRANKLIGISNGSNGGAELTTLAISRANQEKPDYVLPYWFFQEGGPYSYLLRTYWLPIYLAEETRLFMEKFDRLQQDVKDLMDPTSHEDY